MYFRCVAADQWSRKHNSPSFRKSDGGWVQPCVRGTCLLSNQCSRSWSSWGHSCRPWRLLVYGWYYQMIYPNLEALWGPPPRPPAALAVPISSTPAPPTTLPMACWSRVQAPICPYTSAIQRLKLKSLDSKLRWGQDCCCIVCGTEQQETSYS